MTTVFEFDEKDIGRDETGIYQKWKSRREYIHYVSTKTELYRYLNYTPSSVLKNDNEIEPSFIIRGNHSRKDGEKTKYILPISKFKPTLKFNLSIFSHRHYIDKPTNVEYEFRYTLAAANKLKNYLLI